MQQGNPALQKVLFPEYAYESASNSESTVKDQTLKSEYTSNTGSLRLIIDNNNQDSFKRKEKPHETDDPLTPFFPSKELQSVNYNFGTVRNRVKTEPIHQIDLYSVQEMSDEPSEPHSMAQSNIEGGNCDQKNQRLSFRKTNTSFNAHDWQLVQCRGAESAPLSTSQRPTVTYLDQLAEIRSIVDALLQVKSRVEALSSYRPGHVIAESIASLIKTLQHDIEVNLLQAMQTPEIGALNEFRLPYAVEKTSKTYSKDSNLKEIPQLMQLGLSDFSIDKGSPDKTSSECDKISKINLGYQNQNLVQTREDATSPSRTAEVGTNPHNPTLQQPRVLFNYSTDRYKLNDSSSLSSY